MTTIAVVAHRGKSFGGGLSELRAELTRQGVDQPLWYEVAKSRKAPKRARQAAAAGAEIIFVWGGDGTVQRCINALAGTRTRIAILPAGTANLLASNLQIPGNVRDAVEVGLRGDVRRLDTGSVNGEHFAVMAGAGLDARMIDDADGSLKDRLGRVAYLWAGAKNVRSSRVRASIKVDGKKFFKGDVSCVLIGNVGKLFGGIEAFSGAEPDDGLLELGVVTAKNATQWTRTVSRVALGKSEKSPFVEATRGKRFRVRFDRPFAYELDGGARGRADKLRIRVHPKSITVCVPTTPAG